MRELSLFSGAGGGLLGTKLLGWQTVGYMEGKKLVYEEMVFRFQSILNVIDQKEQGLNKPKLYPGMGTKTLSGTFTGD